ncbi:RNA-directed DNA polymerase from transposon X-element, partial [Paramuricea clavata]
VSSVLESLEDGAEKDQIKYQFEQSKNKIGAWKAHILRSINQDQARLDILKNLGPHSALLVLDWAMKFLPRKFREAQSDWFGKRGISWHITVAMRRSDEEIWKWLLLYIYLKSAPRQDNAGCYHSAEVLLSVNQIATKHNMKLSMDFSDPQGGKGSCDRKAATIKTKMRIHLNEGHDIETAEQMVAAIESQGGVSGVRVTLCGPQGIRVWRAYGIGPGKLKLWDDFSVPKDYLPPTLKDPHEVSAHTASVSFTNIMTRRQSKETTVPEQFDSAGEDATDEDNQNAESLFFCSEEGCVMSFQRHSSLQNHLDCGKHKYALECETLFDKAIIMYASKLEQGATCDVPQICEDIPVDVVATPILNMGWALKSTKEYKRLSEKQKTYLLDTYQVGEQTGQKADPVSVSRTMKRARLSSGEPMFTATEYLTAQQIASFYSRETAKRRKAAAGFSTTSQKDKQEVSTEELIQDLHFKVLNAVSSRHPIMYDTYNLCDYASRNKLDRFSILVLQDICSFFELDTSGIKGKRKIKKPYVDLVLNFVEKCTCNL